MNYEQFFIGDIRICKNYNRFNADCIDEWIGGPSPERLIKNSNGTTDYIDYTDEMYKQDAILIKTKNGKYIDLEDVNSILDYVSTDCDNKVKKFCLKNKVMSTLPDESGSLFVDKRSLKSYENVKQKIKSIK